MDKTVQHLTLIVIVDTCISNCYFNGTRCGMKMITNNDDLSYYAILTALVVNLYWNFEQKVRKVGARLQNLRFIRHTRVSTIFIVLHLLWRVEINWTCFIMYIYRGIGFEFFLFICIRTRSIQFKVSQQVWHHISVVEEHKRKSCSCTPTLLTFCFGIECWIIYMCNYSKRRHLAYAWLLTKGPLYESLCSTCKECWVHLLTDVYCISNLHVEMLKNVKLINCLSELHVHGLHELALWTDLNWYSFF